MKKILIGFLVLSSVSAFANILEVNATKTEIRDAIINSLQVKDLTCTDRFDNWKTHRASKLDIANIFSGDFTLNVSSDHSQPLIRLKKIGYFNDPKYKFLGTVSTDSKIKRVTKMTFKTYTNISTVLINTGSILEPIYKEGPSEGELISELICE